MRDPLTKEALASKLGVSEAKVNWWIKANNLLRDFPTVLTNKNPFDGAPRHFIIEDVLPWIEQFNKYMAEMPD